MVAPAFTGLSVHVGPFGREYPLPAPIHCRLRVLPRERIRKRHPSRARRQVAHVQPADAFYVVPQPASDSGWNDRDPVLPALASAHPNFSSCEIEVFDPERQTLQQAQSTSVQEDTDELIPTRGAALQGPAGMRARPLRRGRLDESVDGSGRSALPSRCKPARFAGYSDPGVASIAWRSTGAS